MTSFTYEFEELSLLTDLDFRGSLTSISIIASGRATIEANGEGEWTVTGISLDPKYRHGRHGRNADYDLTTADVWFVLIETALRQHCSDDIRDEIRAAQEAEREDALLARGDRDWHDGIRRQGVEQ